MSQAREMLDRVFSIYIRRRDCPDGQGRCISCGRPINFTTCDAGHYIPRTHTATRWNELNCHGQCRICNRVKHGNLKGYHEVLIHIYGLPIVEDIERLKNEEVHLTDTDYKELTAYYNRRTAILE